MPVLVVGNAVLNGVDQIEATRKLEGGNRAKKGVTIKMEFDPEELLEKVFVRTSLKWRAET